MDSQITIQRLNCMSTILVLSGTVVLFTLLLTTITSADITVANAVDGQLFPQGVPDGKGGIIIVWEDYRTGKDWDVYAQRVDEKNTAMWNQNGIPLSIAPFNQRRLRMVGYDTHAIVVWNDRRGRSSWDIYAQAVSIDGKTLWGKDAIPICTNTADQSTQAILSDEEDGAIFVWEDERRSTEFQDLYIQRVNSEGQTLWEHDGMLVYQSESLQSNPILISGGKDGFFIVWWDVIGSDEWHIMAFRFSYDGKPLWDKPLLVTPKDGMQGVPLAVTDGKGGIIVVWQVYENFINDQFYAQRISSDGSKLWQEKGIPICTADGIQKNAAIVDDGEGGAFVVWSDERDIYSDLYAQRIRADGSLVWKENGIPVCTVGGNQDRPFIVRSADNHIFIAWLDFRGDYGEKSVDSIYCQKIDLDGNLLWDDEGIPVSTSKGEHFPPFVVPVGNGTISVIWSNSQRDSGDIFLKKYEKEKHERIK